MLAYSINRFVDDKNPGHVIVSCSGDLTIRHIREIQGKLTAFSFPVLWGPDKNDRRSMDDLPSKTLVIEIADLKSIDYAFIQLLYAWLRDLSIPDDCRIYLDLQINPEWMQILKHSGFLTLFDKITEKSEPI